MKHHAEWIRWIAVAKIGKGRKEKETRRRKEGKTEGRNRATERESGVKSIRSETRTEIKKESDTRH